MDSRSNVGLFLVGLILLPSLLLVRAAAQDDPNEAPLGDVARNLRKKTAPSRQQVIDDDNLPQVMEQADKKDASRSALRFLMSGDSKAFQISAPDVTCKLAFTANTKSLLSSQYAQMELPPEELEKLVGHATLEGDALSIPVINGTNWHLSELAVAFTVIKKRPAHDGGPFGDPGMGGVAGDPTDPNPFEQVRPEKKPDVTIIYRMRAAAPPWVRTVFSAPVEVEVNSGDEWHWAIVDAKGYPPQEIAENASRPSPHPIAPVVPATASPAELPQAQAASLPSPDPQ